MQTRQNFSYPVRWGVIALALLTLALAPLPAQDVVQIDIQCSPAVVNLQTSPNGTWFTVHADIAYRLVNAATVTLNNIPVKWTKVDNLGYLVAKFQLADVRGLLLPGDNTLTLKGVTVDGLLFSGSATVRVVK
jgi:hypothetical protein